MTSSVPVKGAFNLVSTPSGASYVLGAITDINANQATVLLNTGKEAKVRIDRLPGKGATPQIGEYWILTQPFGDGWAFSYIMSYNGVDQDPTWHAPTLLNSWLNSSAPGTWAAGSGQYRQVGYARDGLGYTVVRGAVKGGTITDSSAAGPITADIFRLPAGYRLGNDGQGRFPVAGGAVLVFPDGYVRAVSGTASLFALDGLRFLAEQ